MILKIIGGHSYFLSELLYHASYLKIVQCEETTSVHLRSDRLWGAWVAQLVMCLTLAQVMICGFKPCDELCADSSEPGACFRFCVSLSVYPSPIHALALSLSLPLKNK